MELFFIDECDYVMAESQEKAFEFYQELTGFSDEEMKEIEILEISEKAKEEIKIRLEAGGGEEPFHVPFNEYIKSFSESDFPCVVASTEW